MSHHMMSLQNPNSEKEKELEKQARIEASLRERERTVQRFRSEQTKEIDREREQHKREEAIQHFKALMSDMVNNTRTYYCYCLSKYLLRFIVQYLFFGDVYHLDM